jgi:hypothetical protein
MDGKLNEIFSNINDWLKFAEAKSAALVAGNAALIFGMSRLIFSNETNEIFVAYLIFCSFLCLVSLSICLLSAVPALNMPWDSKPKGITDTDNLLYFGDIAKYSPLAYLNKLAEKIGNQNEKFSGYQKDLALEIITNSVITQRKFYYFKIAIWISLSAIVSPLISSLLYFIRTK